MTDDLTRLNPQISRLMQYYRHPAEKRPGEGLGKRLLRIGLASMFASGRHYDEAQANKERLLGANIQLNYLKEAQKQAKQQLDVYTNQAAQNMQHAAQQEARAQKVFQAVRRLGDEAVASTGRVQQWATPEGKAMTEAQTGYYKAYADYLKAGGKGGGPNLSDLEKYEKADKARIDDYNKRLTDLGKKLRDPLVAQTPQKMQVVGEYARTAYQAMADLSQSKGMTVDSGTIPQDFQNAMAQVGQVAKEAWVDMPWSTTRRVPFTGLKLGVGQTTKGIRGDWSLQEALAAKMQEIRKNFTGPTQAPWAQSEEFSSALLRAIQDLLPYTTNIDEFLLGVGDATMAVELFHNYFLNNPGELGIQ